MKDELLLSYRKVAVVTANFNKPENLAQRQYAAFRYVSFLKEGITIINIDESVLRVTDARTRGWTAFGQRNLCSHSQRLNQVNIIAAITSKGHSYFQLNQGSTNSFTIAFFITNLARLLDKENPNWSSSSILLLDNATYHRSTFLREVFNKLGVNVLYLGPYQFKMAPVENFFSFIKNRDLNPLNVRAYSRQVYISINIMCRGYVVTYLKELAVHISRLDTQWVQRAFAHVLIGALEALALTTI